jgi:hypothetical protein
MQAALSLLSAERVGYANLGYAFHIRVDNLLDRRQFHPTHVQLPGDDIADQPRSVVLDQLDLRSGSVDDGGDPLSSVVNVFHDRKLLLKGWIENYEACNVVKPQSLLRPAIRAHVALPFAQV